MAGHGKVSRVGCEGPEARAGIGGFGALLLVCFLLLGRGKVGSARPARADGRPSCACADVAVLGPPGGRQGGDKMRYKKSN